MNIRAAYKATAKHIKPVAYQNAVTLVNVIFLIVTLLLLAFKEAHEALFLAIVLILNVVIGIIQDLRAKIALEQLQILMTPKITRLNSRSQEETALLEDLSAGDLIKISLGDQIPADGELEESFGLEVNEALLTGESDNIHKKQSDNVLAGSFVTAGSGILRVTVKPQDSFVSKMTEKIKQYTLNLSPIQQTLNAFIKYMTYLLLAIVLYVVIHGLTGHELMVYIVKDIAALTGTLVPQGLILATTVFFAYGAVRLLKKQVLLQEINATEKLGRIKNLCVDKTGTLTENKPVLEQVVMYGNVDRALVEQSLCGYVQANRDDSNTIKALTSSVRASFAGSVFDYLPFSSSRKYGIASLKINDKNLTVAVGAPDMLVPFLSEGDEKKWLESQLANFAPQAKRLVLLGQADQAGASPLSQPVLHPLALFVLGNPLRPGTKEIIGFFQSRGVRLYVLSGDNPQTVQAIARQSGIKHSDMVVTGAEMEKWDNEAFEERVPAYHLFARIKPGQKEQIISILKTKGFTAMVGDGANDALAIKNADLGVAMFDGAGATRQIAQIVLMNNSFAALPDGVDLAETIITNIELVASIFLNKVAVALCVFLALAIMGYTYPLSPRNTTIINYFVIWLPMFYWAIFPAPKDGFSPEKGFFRKILPFSLAMGLLTALASAAVFWLGPDYLKTAGSNILVVLALIALGYWFFVLAPLAHGIKTSKKQEKVLFALAGVGIIFLATVLLNPALSNFFDLRRPTFWSLFMTVCVVWITGWLQYQITARWFAKKWKSKNPPVPIEHSILS
ncbi:MAG: HAD-IC family P-type ATPase [Patescibacteria group bacterium]|nr:HAD-IC family P-type ATPase [Patescibacteria group bacterium]